MKKLIVFKEINGPTFFANAEQVAHNRATYYASREKGLDVYKEEYHYTLQDNFELKDWFLNNMNPGDLEWVDEDGNRMKGFPNSEFEDEVLIIEQ